MNFASAKAHKLCIKVLNPLQTVFYLDDYITCKKGEEVTGVFTMKPNARNVRDLDFEISVNFEGELCTVKESTAYRMR